MKNKSYIGISFIILVFGIYAIPKIIDRVKNNDVSVQDRLNVPAKERKSEEAKNLVKIGNAPQFSLTDQNGKTISNKDFEGKVVAYSADVSDKEKSEGMIDEAIKLFGKVDILVNNAGIMDDMSGVDETSDEMFDKVYNVNVKSIFYSMRKAVNYFKEVGGGVIINVASIGGLNGCRAGLAYTSSKHAVVGMTKNTAFMYALQNIRMFCSILLFYFSLVSIWSHECRNQSQSNPKNLQHILL